MKRLPLPSVSVAENYETCASGIKSGTLKYRIESELDTIVQLSDQYEDLAKKGDLFKLQALCKDFKSDGIVVAKLTKAEFINLYEYYFRGPEKPGRVNYDKLMLSAKDKCPFCGGIGRPRNLDHFLPKKFFPQFSISPLNLIPACRDCNMDGKGKNYAKTSAEQIIHPYLDKECFFRDKWISGRLIKEDPLSIEFFTHTPDNWDAIDKIRAITHFHDFDLAKRYSIQAAEELSVLIEQRKSFMKTFSCDDFQQYLASFQSQALFINHWKRVMYRCLAEDDWFCSFDF